MLKKPAYQHTNLNLLIRVVLVFTLLFSSMHIAFHDVGDGNDSIDGHSECQTCRISHIPVDLSTFSLPAPLVLLSYSATAINLGYQLSPSRRTQRTRAPPILH